MKELVGTKIALINGKTVLAILRDDKPDIDFPGMWDLPGGAREGSETPTETVLREVREELGIEIKAGDIVWRKVFPAVSHPGREAMFMVVNISDEELQAITFGDEGREWTMMSFDKFLAHDNAVPGMQARLAAYLKHKRQAN